MNDPQHFRVGNFSVNYNQKDNTKQGNVKHQQAQFQYYQIVKFPGNYYENFNEFINYNKSIQKSYFENYDLRLRNNEHELLKSIEITSSSSHCGETEMEKMHFFKIKKPNSFLSYEVFLSNDREIKHRIENNLRKEMKTIINISDRSLILIIV